MNAFTTNPRQPAIPCATCGAPISSEYGINRALRRGYGYCSQSCDAAAKTKKAAGELLMRVMRRVDIRGHDECWPYTGRLSRGYGVIDFDGRPVFAHRLVYEIGHGKQPGDLHVCHSCDNPRCCNPGHLWLGTAKDNAQDMLAKGRARHVTRRGEQSHYSKLTERDVLAIRASDEKTKVLATRFGVTTAQILNIKRRRHWTHV